MGSTTCTSRRSHLPTWSVTASWATSSTRTRGGTRRAKPSTRGRRARSDRGADRAVSVFVANESGAPVDETNLVALARHVLDTLGVSPLAELSVLAVDEGAM